MDPEQSKKLLEAFEQVGPPVKKASKGKKRPAPARRKRRERCLRDPPAVGAPGSLGAAPPTRVCQRTEAAAEQPATPPRLPPAARSPASVHAGWTECMHAPASTSSSAAHSLPFQTAPRTERGCPQARPPARLLGQPRFAKDMAEREDDFVPLPGTRAPQKVGVFQTGIVVLVAGQLRQKSPSPDTSPPLLFPAGALRCVLRWSGPGRTATPTPSVCARLGRCTIASMRPASGRP